MKIVRLEAYDAAKVVRGDDKTEKRCPTCKQTKPIGEFNRNAGSYDGWQSYCRPCAVEVNRAHRQRRLDGLIPTTTPEEKLCYGCQATKPAADFARCLARHDGLQPICRECQREEQWRRRFGISRRDYDALFAQQAGRCGVCREETVLVVDHCHDSGRVRGLLCNNCNCLLGFAKDDLDRLQAAMSYLESSRAEAVA